jgi:phosphate transport system substrate-binding protein
MNRIALIITLFVAATIFAANSQGWSQTSIQPTEQKKLTAAGSGVNLGITRILAEAFIKEHPNITIDVPGSIGTRGAIKAVTDGAITFGLISRPLTEEEKKLGLVAQPYAQTAIIIGAYPSVPDEGITSRELIEIFKGTKTRWKNGQEIIVQAREKSDSGFSVLENNIPGFREAYAESHAANRWTIYFTDQDANRALSTTPYAIGVTDLGMISTEHLYIKVLKLNGIAPSPENLQNGTYPLSRQLSFLYRKDNLPQEADDFFRFVFSDTGRALLQSNGYLPVN